MPIRLRVAAATGIHTLVGLLIAWAVVHGVDIPANWGAPIELAVMSAVVAGWAAAVHWLSTRPVTTVAGRFAVRLSRILTLGAGALSATKPVDPAVAALRANKTVAR